MKCALCFSVNMLISIILNYKVSIFDLLIKPQRSEVYVWPNRLLSCCYQLHSLLFDMQHDNCLCPFDLSTRVKGVGKSGLFTCILFYISLLSI